MLLVQMALVKIVIKNTIPSGLIDKFKLNKFCNILIKYLHKNYLKSTKLFKNLEKELCF